MKKKIGAVLLVIIIAVALGLPAPPAARAASIIYVDADATEGDNDGSSWDDAYTDLQSALASAASGDEIWVADGTYKPGTDRSDTFLLDSGEKVYGGFEGIETSREERDWEDHETILSGDIHSTDYPYDNSYHVVMVEGEKAAILDGFTITGGEAVEDPYKDTPDNWGAGIYNNGTLTVNNCNISDNWAYWRGGGIYNSGTLTVNSCSIEENSVSRAGGGGIYNNEGTLTVNNSTISYNKASYDGGGIYNNEGTLTVNNSTISYNKASYGDGGGIYNNGELTVNNSDIIDNTASYYGGGGIYSNGELTVNNSTFSNNSAGRNGGGLATHALITPQGPVGGSATLNNNIFTNNKTTVSETNRGGGGIYLADAPVTLINSIVNGNTSAAQGGGIRAGGVCELIIINSTIVNNTADTEGGGIRIGGGTKVITNSILWGNTSLNKPLTNQFTGSPTVTYSLVQDGYPAGKKVISDLPLFVNAYNDLHLQDDSPAIDAGKNSAVPAGITVDLDGNPRIVNRTVDMGAFEYLTAQQADTLDLIEQVGELVDDEVLNPGQGNSLIVKLEAAFDQMYRNNNTAINQLEAFVNQVKDFIEMDILTEEEGDPLIYAANLIIAAL